MPNPFLALIVFETDTGIVLKIYIYFIGSEIKFYLLPNLSEESNIPFYSTINRYNKEAIIINYPIDPKGAL